MYYWIYAFFSGLMFFLGISLLVRRTSLNNRMLGLHILLMAFILLVVYFNFSGLMDMVPHLFKTASPAGYLYGPVYYFFILSTVRPNFRFRALHLLHLLPFALHVLELTPFFLLSAEDKLSLYREFSMRFNNSPLKTEWGNLSYRIHTILKLSLVIGYTLAGLYSIWPLMNGSHEGNNTPFMKKVITWIKFDIALKLSIASVTIIIYYFFWLFPDSLHRIHFFTFPLSTLFSALMVLFYPELALLRPLTENAAIEETKTQQQEVAFRWPAAPENPEDNSFLEELETKLQEYYSQEGLDIPALAKMLFLSERTLYRKTKEVFGKSPSQVLLDFRMERAYQQIQKNPEMPITQVAAAVGLKSNGHFSSNFSDRYGILPSDLQKSFQSK